jgi:hypothetical protein
MLIDIDQSREDMGRPIAIDKIVPAALFQAG